MNTLNTVAFFGNFMEGATNIETLPNASGSMTGVQPVQPASGGSGGGGGGGGGSGGGVGAGMGSGAGGGNSQQSQQPPTPNFQQPISMSVQQAQQGQLAQSSNMVIGGAPTMGGMPNMPGLPASQHMGFPPSMPLQSQPMIPAAIPQDMVSQIIQQLQQGGGSVTGASNPIATFPSRDVPNTFADLTQDPATRANFVPGMGGGLGGVGFDNVGGDYIRDYDQQGNSKQTQPPKSMLDASWMDELMLPIIMSAIFFLFQLPFINRQLRLFFPTLFTKEGHLDIFGLVIKSLLFGAGCYGIKKMADLSAYL